MELRRKDVEEMRAEEERCGGDGAEEERCGGDES